MNVSSAMTPAWDWMVQVLFRPFRLRKWFALGFVALLAGSGGGSSFNVPTGNDNDNPFSPDVLNWIGAHIVLLVLLGVLLMLAGLVLSWVCSVMKFVYTDQVARNSMEIRAPFKRFMSQGLGYLAWVFVFVLVAILVIFILAGLPIIYVWALAHGMQLGAQIAVTIIAGLVGLALFLLMFVIMGLAEQFVVPAMYLRNAGVIEGWQIVIPILRRNVGQVLLYMLMLLAIGLGIGMAGILVMLVILLLLAIPGVLLFAIGYGIYEAARESWSVGLICYIAVFGSALLAAFIYFSECALQPGYVFLKALSLVVLGQAEPALATIPTGPPPYKAES